MTTCNIKNDIPYWNTSIMSSQYPLNLMVELVTANLSSIGSLWIDNYGNNVSLVGGTKVPVQPTDIFGNYLIPNGVSSYGMFPSKLDIVDKVTITMWIKAPPDFSGTKVFVSNRTYQNSGYTFAKYAYGGNPLYFTTGDGTTNSTVTSSSLTWTPETWYHVGVSYLSPTATFYVNGYTVGSGTMPFTGNTPTAPSNMYFGAYPSIINFLNASVAELRIYNISLNSTEILYDYTHSAVYYLLRSIEGLL